MGGSRNRYLIVELDCKWKKESQNSHSASLKELTLCLCISVGCQMEKCKWDIQLLNQCLFDKVSARKTGFSLKCRKRLWIAVYKQWQQHLHSPHTSHPSQPLLQKQLSPAERLKQELCYLPAQAQGRQGSLLTVIATAHWFAHKRAVSGLLRNIYFKCKINQHNPEHDSFLVCL